MPMSRAPRQLLTAWVSHSRPTGCPQMTWGRALENALKSKGISREFDERIIIAKDRSKWKQLTHSIPKPPDAGWLKNTSRVNHYNFFLQKRQSAHSGLFYTSAVRRRGIGVSLLSPLRPVFGNGGPPGPLSKPNVFRSFITGRLD